MNALEVSGLSKSLGDFRLQNVSFAPPKCPLHLRFRLYQFLKKY